MMPVFSPVSPRELERLRMLASSGYPSEWAASRHAAEIVAVVERGIVPSPEAVRWFLAWRDRR